MPVIKLTQNDINEMVRRTVHSILSESVKEVQGSIMAEKEDVIQEIVDYVENAWEEIKRNGTKPVQEGQYMFDNKHGIKFSGIQRDYAVLIPQEITEKIGLAEDFQVNVGINDYAVPEGMDKYFGQAERSTEGASYGGPEFSKFIRTKKKTTKGRIDLYVPSVNGELQVQGFHSTLYHELNHSAGRLELQKKHQDLGDDELQNLNYFSATNRKGPWAHRMTYHAMFPEKDPFTKLFGILGMQDDQKFVKLKKEMATMFYGLWEITERNARAEAIYGDLKAMGTTRESFREDYRKTDIYRQIQELNDSISHMEEVETPNELWNFAAEVMNMNARGKSNNSFAAKKRYQEAVKQRFLKRSRELLENLYKKAMKVAALYFQRQEERAQDEPGGGLERLGQLLNTD